MLISCLPVLVLLPTGYDACLSLLRFVQVVLESWHTTYGLQVVPQLPLAKIWRKMDTSENVLHLASSNCRIFEKYLSCSVVSGPPRTNSSSATLTVETRTGIYNVTALSENLRNGSPRTYVSQKGNRPIMVDVCLYGASSLAGRPCCINFSLYRSSTQVKPCIVVECYA